MTTTRSASIEEIANALVSLVKVDESVRRLYGRAGSDAVELWLLTEEIDLEHELRLYELAVTLDREFPSSVIGFHLVNPANFTPFELEQTVPLQDPHTVLLHEL